VVCHSTGGIYTTVITFARILTFPINTGKTIGTLLISYTFGLDTIAGNTLFCGGALHVVSAGRFKTAFVWVSPQRWWAIADSFVIVNITDGSTRTVLSYAWVFTLRPQTGKLW